MCGRSQEGHGTNRRGLKTALLLRSNPFFEALADEHRGWISAFDAQYLKNWEKLLNADEEAAFAEARVRSLLQSYGIAVEPSEDLRGVTQRPDYLCFIRDHRFYVEVTCISKDVATAKTGIPDEPHGLTGCQPLTDSIFGKCRGKARQCGNLDVPALIAVGTFHTFAAMLSFTKPCVNSVLTGKTGLGWTMDTHTGKKVDDGCVVTELDSAAFLCCDETQEIGYARSSISGLLLCGLGSEPIRILGILHPNPARPFDPAVLPQVEFGELVVDGTLGELRVMWRDDDSEL